MKMLPKWVLSNPFPAIHDFESLTVIDQTARVYSAMNALIKEYNNFADTVNTHLSTFTETEQTAREEFETQITKVMREFICSTEQNLKVNLEETAQTLINEAIKRKDIMITEEYEEETGALWLYVGGVV